jgi:DNA-binding XRE family transcriptional regulator
MANRVSNAQTDSVKEVWLPVVGWESFYEVSNIGRVRSVDRIDEHVCAGRTVRRPLKGKLRKLHLHKGYPHVGLNAEGRASTKAVHVLVAEAFLGPRPEGMQVAHGDGNPANPRVENLRWATQVENAHDALIHGARAMADRAGASKLSWDEVREIRRIGGSETQAALAERFGIKQTTVMSILLNRTWRDPSYVVPSARRKGSTKLTAEQIEQIRNMQGLSQSKIGELFGVTQGRVWQIKRSA